MLRNEPMMARLDPYGQSLRDEQKAVINALLGIIYDNYDTTRRIQERADSTYRMVWVMLVLFILIVIVIAGLGCYFGCQKIQRERHLPLHQPTTSGRKSTPIEI